MNNYFFKLILLGDSKVGKSNILSQLVDHRFNNFFFKLILLGDSKVGKSNILSQLVDHRFNNFHDTTIGIDFNIYTTCIDDKMFKLQIWDTAGNDKFRFWIRSSCRSIVGAFLIYDITNRNSFMNILSWLSDVREGGNNDIVIMLVGNKIDQEEKREVSSDEAILFAEQNNLFFIETSAQERINLEQTFMTVVMYIYENIKRGKYDLSNAFLGIKVYKK
ncbi:hypothetical protein SteCoe_38392 [Stentor coeruleus]|uniref:Uncharacterized protein n=1 Tax=Stentor coeruleus TaxID=5963 RepID=A0A1R2ALI5_9CILI|nr:hypothetical protein SteCoe_38392 [Stentor coeruleus]